MSATARAVVLDFDGVLVDSMPNHAASYRRILAPYGRAPSDRDIFLQEGARSESIIRAELEAAGRAAEPGLVKRLADQKQEAFRSLDDPQLYPAARALVGSLREAAPLLALVTGTRRANLDRLIPDLLPHFDAVLAQDSYQHDKPHPEPYAKAAEALGVPPERCAVLENAVRGVESARAAGYGYVVALTTTLRREDLEPAQPDMVVETHEAAVEALTAWLDGSRRSG